MIRIAPQEEHSRFSFTLVEGHLKTIISRSSHGDLLMRQELPGQAPVHVSSYSDSGLSIYAFLAKYHALHGRAPVRIPVNRNEPKGKSYLESDMAPSEVRTALIREFPYRFHNQSTDEMSHVHVTKSGLEIESGKKRMILSPELVHALLEYIPQVFPSTRPYRALFAGIRRGIPRTFPTRGFRTKPPAGYSARVPKTKSKPRPNMRRRRPGTK